MGEKDDYSSAKLLVKGAGLVFIGMIIGRLLGYLSRLVVARYLGPADYGLLILGFSIFSIVSVIGLLGLEAGLRRFVPEFLSRGEKNKIRPLTYYTLKISMSLSLAIAAILFFSADFLAASIFHSKALAGIIQIFSLAIPFSTAASIFLGVIFGSKKADYKVYMDDLAKPGSRLLFLGMAVFLGYGLVGSSVAYLLSFIAAAIAGMLLFIKISGKSASSLDKKEKKKILVYSLPIMLTTIAFIIMGQINSLLLGYLKVPSDVGIYNAAIPTADILVMVSLSIMTLFLPIISELFQKKKLGEIGRLYKKTVKWITAFSIPTFLAFIIFPEQVLNMLFGLQYAGAAPALIILSFGYFIGVVLYPSYDIINVFKKTGLHLYISIGSVLINTVLGFILIQIYGVIGAAIATSVAFSFIGIATTYIAHRLFGQNPYSAPLCKTLGAGAVTFGLFFTVSMFFRATTLVSILLIFLLIGVYGCLLLALKVFDKEDVSIIESVERKIKLKSRVFSRLVGKFAADATNSNEG